MFARSILVLGLVALATSAQAKACVPHCGNTISKNGISFNALIDNGLAFNGLETNNAARPNAAPTTGAEAVGQDGPRVISVELPTETP